MKASSPPWRSPPSPSPRQFKAIRADAANIQQSYGQGNQTFPNTDRYFDGQNAHID